MLQTGMLQTCCKHDASSAHAAAIIAPSMAHRLHLPATDWRQTRGQINGLTNGMNNGLTNDMTDGLTHAGSVFHSWPNNPCARVLPHYFCRF